MKTLWRLPLGLCSRSSRQVSTNKADFVLSKACLQLLLSLIAAVLEGICVDPCVGLEMTMLLCMSLVIYAKRVGGDTTIVVSAFLGQEWARKIRVGCRVLSAYLKLS